MASLELNNNEGFELTEFDRLKIESMDIGDSIDAECGNFRVLRYKSGYMLFVFNEALIRKTNTTVREFFEMDKLIKFLRQ